MKEKKTIVLIVRDVSKKSAGLSISTFLRAKSLSIIKNWNCSLMTCLDVLKKDDIDIINKNAKDFKILFYKEVFNRIPSIFYLKKIFDNLKKSSVIYIYSLYQPISYVAFLMGLFMKKEIWFRPHGSLMPEYTKNFSFLKNIYTYIELYLYSFSKYILFSSKLEATCFCYYVKTHIRSQSLIAKGRVTTDSYDISYFQKFFSNEELLKFKNPNRDIDLLFLSRLTPIKGILIFLEAVADLCDDTTISKPFKIVIAGIPDKDFLKKYSIYKNKFKNKVNLDVSYVGMVSEKRKWELLFNSKNFILPTLSDSFGIAIVEALSANVKIASTKMLGCAEYIDSLDEFTYLDVTPYSIKKYITRLMKESFQKKFSNYSKIENLINSKLSIFNQSIQYKKLLENNKN